MMHGPINIKNFLLFADLHLYIILVINQLDAQNIFL